MAKTLFSIITEKEHITVAKRTKNACNILSLRLVNLVHFRLRFLVLTRLVLLTSLQIRHFLLCVLYIQRKCFYQFFSSAFSILYLLIHLRLCHNCRWRIHIIIQRATDDNCIGRDFICKSPTILFAIFVPYLEKMETATAAPMSMTTGTLCCALATTSAGISVEHPN